MITTTEELKLAIIHYLRTLGRTVEEIEFYFANNWIIITSPGSYVWNTAQVNAPDPTIATLNSTYWPDWQNLQTQTTLDGYYAWLSFYYPLTAMEPTEGPNLINALQGGLDLGLITPPIDMNFATLVADNANISNTSSGSTDYVEINASLQQTVTVKGHGIIKATLVLPSFTKVELGMRVVGHPTEDWIGIVTHGDGGPSGVTTINGQAYDTFIWIEDNFVLNDSLTVTPVFANIDGNQLEFYDPLNPPTFFDTVTFILESY